MPNGKETDIQLPSLDELFSSQEERDDAKLKRIYEIPLEEIDPFPDHPYKVRDDEDMDNLVESVKANGIITPATVRRKEDGRYELLSGHRRMRASELAGLKTLRCEIVEMTRDEATIFMVESNFQRTQILPSEKAFAYKMRLEAMKRLPGRPEKGAPAGPNFGERSRDMLAQETGDSKSQIQRYIRLTKLVPELLEMVDAQTIAMRPAVELSYLPEEAQRELVECIDMQLCTPSHSQALRMRRMQEEGKLTPEVIEAILLEQKPNQKERIVLHGERFRGLFPKDLPLSQREDYVAAAMEHYGKYLQRMSRQQER